MLQKDPLLVILAGLFVTLLSCVSFSTTIKIADISFLEPHDNSSKFLRLLYENLNIFFCSDHIALLKAFEAWKDAKRSGRDRAFCWEKFLSPITLQMMDDMRNQFFDLLSDIGFVNKAKGIKVCLCMEFQLSDLALLFVKYLIHYFERTLLH